jgi:uncharacterized protein (DUF983 family)
MTAYKQPHPFKAGVMMRCPRCGQGTLFAGMLSLVDECSECALPLKQADNGDGPAFFVITFIGGLITVLAAIVELQFAPPSWVHVVLWVPMVLVSSLFFLRLFKAILVAYQFKHKITGFEE